MEDGQVVWVMGWVIYLLGATTLFAQGYFFDLFFSICMASAIGVWVFAYYVRRKKDEDWF